MRSRPFVFSILALLFVPATGWSVDALTGSLEQPNERGTVAERQEPGASAGAPETSAQETEAAVEFLLKSVAESGHRFIRNGKSYPGKAAAQHMRRKYRHLRAQIKSPEDFVKHAATRSEATGRPYLVEISPGSRVPSEQWMFDRLREYRNRGPRP